MGPKAHIVGALRKAQGHSTRLRQMLTALNGRAEGHEQGEAQRSRVEWLQR